MAVSQREEYIKPMSSTEKHDKEPTPAWKEIANSIAERQNCDILCLNSPLCREIDIKLINLCRGRNKRKNVLLILVTEGGDAEPAYRISRCLQEYYEEFTCFVNGYCKSAGTLVALGATELVVSDRGELGPLDVQLSKEDELGVTRSGLTIHSALNTLHNAAYAAFEYFFLETKKRSRGTITTPTAIRVATELSGKLFAPIYSHIDAMHVGEADRSLKIAHKYGRLLQPKSRNFEIQTLDTLTTNYPSHAFIIDRYQAKELFTNVRPPDNDEEKLAESLGEVSTNPVAPSEPFLVFINDEVKPPKDGEDNDERPTENSQDESPESEQG